MDAKLIVQELVHVSIEIGDEFDSDRLSSLNVIAFVDCAVGSLTQRGYRGTFSIERSIGVVSDLDLCHTVLQMRVTLFCPFLEPLCTEISFSVQAMDLSNYT